MGNKRKLQRAQRFAAQRSNKPGSEPKNRGNTTMSDEGTTDINLPPGKTAKVTAVPGDEPAPAQPGRMKMATFAAAAKTAEGLRRNGKAIAYTSLLLIAAIIGYCAVFGIRFTFHNPTRVDAGWITEWKFNRDKGRYMDVTNRLGNVEAYNISRAGVFKQTWDDEGPVWKYTGDKRPDRSLW